MDMQHIVEDSAEMKDDVREDEEVDMIDLSAEAIAKDAETLEDIAYDTTTKKKRPLGEDDDGRTADSHVRKKKKSNNNNRKSQSKKEGKYDKTKLNDSTTIDDLSTIDASAYLAWVNSQAGSLPSVFVAKKQTDNTSENKNAIKEDPIDGSAATLQILLSKQMDILPPPTTRHAPPTCSTATFHFNNASSIETTSNDIDNEKQHDNNNNACSNWVSTIISTFSKLRSYLETQDAILKQNNVDSQSKRKVAVPKMKDRTGWHVFCLGREEAFGNRGGYFEEEIESDHEEGSNDERSQNDNDENVDGKVETEEDLEGTDTKVLTEDTKVLTYNQSDVPPDGYVPTTSLLLQIDQVLTRVLFHHHVHYLCEWKFPLTHQRAAWIYALLARMDKPWHRDECCAVRKVLRECCSRRWELSLPKEGDDCSLRTLENHKEWEQLALLNTLIAITGVYYEQGSKAGGDGIDLLFRPSQICADVHHK